VFWVDFRLLLFFSCLLVGCLCEFFCGVSKIVVWSLPNRAELRGCGAYFGNAML